jgi:hypothetical protein
MLEQSGREALLARPPATPSEGQPKARRRVAPPSGRHWICFRRLAGKTNKQGAVRVPCVRPRRYASPPAGARVLRFPALSVKYTASAQGARAGCSSMG